MKEFVILIQVILFSLKWCAGRKVKANTCEGKPKYSICNTNEIFQKEKQNCSRSYKSSMVEAVADLGLEHSQASL